MKKISSLIMLFCVVGGSSMASQSPFETDTFQASTGALKITFIGHGTLMLEFGGKIIHVDPYSKLADYSKLPKADLVLISHEHSDHLDLEALGAIRSEKTIFVINEACAEKIPNGKVMKNGDERVVEGFKIEAIPAYNLVHKRDNGQPFHPKGVGNGYVVTFGDKRVYVAGDTENIPEMKSLRNIDIAFLPMNVPFTMTPEMTADAALMFQPKVLYPYHFGATDVSRLTALLKDAKAIDVRVRKMQ